MSGWRVPGYSELRLLGEGAQGRVVLARHDATGRPAAIKYLAGALLGDEGFRERFRGEADLLSRLRNPFVAQLFGLVETPDGAAIVMEAVDGAPLKAVLAERGPLAPEAALALLKGSLLGLAAAHGLGIVHRDYKPANVIVRGDGLSKLIDFGIAVDAGASGRAGTPVYMAPEQWRDEPASPATDVYAAACVFYECVTGRRPYTAEDPAGLMGRHLTAPIPVEDVPEPLRPLIQSGLAKNPWDRPMGAAAFVTELESVAAGAYGADWEGRGVRTLAGTVAALSMLFPLTALGLGSGGASASAAGAAGAAGRAEPPGPVARAARARRRVPRARASSARSGRRGRRPSRAAPPRWPWAAARRSTWPRRTRRPSRSWRGSPRSASRRGASAAGRRSRRRAASCASRAGTPRSPGRSTRPCGRRSNSAGRRPATGCGTSGRAPTPTS